LPLEERPRLMCRYVERTFGCGPRTVAESRHFVADTLHQWGVSQTDPAMSFMDNLALVTSELVTNATTFCTTQVRVTLTAHRDKIELTVADDDRAPAVLGEFNVDSIGGRGIAIVAALSDSWGQLPWNGREKIVWSEFAVPSGSALAEGCRI
jgi:hypothetical protein